MLENQRENRVSAGNNRLVKPEKPSAERQEAAVLPEDIKAKRLGLMGRFRRVAEDFLTKDGGVKKELTDKMAEDLAAVEKRSVIEGVDFSRAQLEDLKRDCQSGRKLEIETFSPYLADYNTSRGDIRLDRLTAADEIGLQVGTSLKKIFPKARIISLYDEYNSGLPGSSDFSGRPVSDLPGGQTAAQIEFSDVARWWFYEEVKRLMADRGIISPRDIEGENYFLIAESEKIKDAALLVERLESKGLIRRDGEKIVFHNSEAENPAHQEIVLRTKNGRWLCEALDASAYIKPENLEATHLVVLSNDFKEQQDKVWEMLRVLGIDSSHYHNIFYDEKAPPEKVVQVVTEAFAAAGMEASA